MDLEKNEKANDLALTKGLDRRESIESYNNLHDQDPNAETSIAKRKLRTLNDATSNNNNNNNNNNLASIHPTRSRSSVRSQRSYAGADGYTHFEHDDHNDQDIPAGRLESDDKAGTTAVSDTTTNDAKAFEVQWSGPNDPMNPKSDAWAPMWRKWSIVILGSGSAMCVTFASALYTSAYGGMEEEFAVSRLAVTVGLSTFVCGLGLGPMFLGPLSEFYGRRPVYLCAFGLYFVWLIPCALADNLATMLVARFLDGLAGSAFLSVAGGTVGDTFPKDKLSMPMCVYSAAPFCGPLLGPVVGGFIASYKSWRWCFYVLMMWAGVNWLLLYFFVPETYAPVLLRRKARKLRKETGDERHKAPIEMMNKSVAKTVVMSCTRPFQLLVLEVSYQASGMGLWKESMADLQHSQCASVFVFCRLFCSVSCTCSLV
jgi:multidrug resistance protein